MRVIRTTFLLGALTLFLMLVGQYVGGRNGMTLKGHNESYSHYFSAGSAYALPNAGGPVRRRAKRNDSRLGNCDLHERVRIFFLGQNCLALQRRAACFAGRVASALRSDGAPRGKSKLAGSEAVRNSGSRAECLRNWQEPASCFRRRDRRSVATHE